MDEYFILVKKARLGNHRERGGELSPSRTRRRLTSSGWRPTWPSRSTSVYHPYTSLKYHTLLVVALLDNYRAGNEFAELRFIVDPAGEIVPFRTVFDGERFALRIDIEDGRRRSACLGSRPWRSWASAWNCLTAHPLDTDRDKYDMTLDANLRRTQSWSTALQYIEDYHEWRSDR